MADEHEIKKYHFPKYFINRDQILRQPLKYAALELAILIALATAAYFLGRHLFDLTIPSEGDVRSHIFKIEILQSYLSHFSWPQWIPWWYHGIPLDQFYPPGFYFLGAILTFIFQHAVIAYKLLLLLALMLNGLIIFFFARRFLKFDSHLAIWCLLAYETSTPLLINFMYGEGPNLLGWTTTLAFLTLYLSYAVENRTSGIIHKLLPGFLLGISILIHPFPVIFAVIVVAIFHIVWLAHNRSFKVFLHSHLPYLASVFGIGLLIGMYYWLPAFLTLDYSSPIYSFTKFMWPGGTRYLLAIIFLALATTLATRYKIRGDVRFDLMIISFCLAAALGFGATNYLPFGLGSLVQEFRFATIVIPFFGILLILYPLKYKPINLSATKLALSVAIGLVATALVFGLDNKDSLGASLKSISEVNANSFFTLVGKQFSAGYASFAVTVLPYFILILFLALAVSRKVTDAVKTSPTFALAGGICLILLTSFIPYIYTGTQDNLNRIFSYVDHYQTPDYAQIMQRAQGGRMIVPPGKGYLIEGDSPVTYAWHWGVETVNGPYNQGDPKFFKSTVHLEWEERWLDYQFTRENLMQESAAEYIFIRDSLSLPANLNGLKQVEANSYGKLLGLDQDVARSVKVTPILLDVKNSQYVTEFFNILLPGGYKLVLVDTKDVPPDMKDMFTNVMTDDKSKLPKYGSKTVFLLNNTDNASIEQNGSVIKVNLPYLNFSNKLFYHGDEADGYWWIGWDNWAGAKIYPDQDATLLNFSALLANYVNNLEYTPVNYQQSDNRIQVSSSDGFTLIKDSYFPYWKINQGRIITTTQGFMLTYANTSNLTLNFQRPLYYRLSTVITVMSLIVAVAFLIYLGFRRTKMQQRRI